MTKKHVALFFRETATFSVYENERPGDGGEEREKPFTRAKRAAR